MRPAALTPASRAGLTLAISLLALPWLADAAAAQPRKRVLRGDQATDAAPSAAGLVAAPANAEGEGEGEEGDLFLYNQLDHPTGEGVPDQDFEAELDAFDAEAADDFEIGYEHGWDIHWVRTAGSTDGAATSVDLAIHRDEAGVPGAALCSHPGLVPVESAGSFTIGLPEVCHLGPGRYWLSLQTNQDYAPNGQHFWSNRSLQAFEPGIWRNPGDGFETGCTGWTHQQICGVGDGQGPDYLFAIGGELGHAPQAPDGALVAVPTLDWKGIGALIAALAALGAFALRRAG